MKIKEYWENVYLTKSPDKVSWFQEHAEQSLRLIENTKLPLSASIIDVGGGASTLVDDLVLKGYSSITVLDLSTTAMLSAKERLKSNAAKVNWVEADILEAALPIAAYDLWHDRAVFHFLTKQEQRNAYILAVERSVKPGGHIIIATFAEDGPTQCSGLPVNRYTAEQLHSEFGSAFKFIKQEKEGHSTPFGTLQKFIYCYCRKD